MDSNLTITSNKGIKRHLMIGTERKDSKPRERDDCSKQRAVLIVSSGALALKQPSPRKSLCDFVNN